MNIKQTALKISSVMESCKTMEQLDNAKNMFAGFTSFYYESDLYWYYYNALRIEFNELKNKLNG